LKLSSKQPEYSDKLEEYSKQAVSWMSTEEYKKLACELNVCSSRVILGVYDLVKLCYKSVARKRIMKTIGNRLRI
jgi:hypothetical protein